MMNLINSAIVNVQAGLTVAADRISERLSARSEGQAMVEYGLILVLVSVVAIVGLTVVGGQLYNPNATLPSGAHVHPFVWGTGAAAPGAFNQIIAALSDGVTIK